MKIHKGTCDAQLCGTNSLNSLRSNPLQSTHSVNSQHSLTSDHRNKSWTASETKCSLHSIQSLPLKPRTWFKLRCTILVYSSRQKTKQRSAGCNYTTLTLGAGMGSRLNIGQMVNNVWHGRRCSTGQQIMRNIRRPAVATSYISNSHITHVVFDISVRPQSPNQQLHLICSFKWPLRSHKALV